MASIEVRLLPTYLEIDGIVVEVLEILHHKLSEDYHLYTVSARINYKGIKSKVFSIDCKDIKDLMNKLKIEITKIKFMELVLGLPELRRIIT